MADIDVYIAGDYVGESKEPRTITLAIYSQRDTKQDAAFLFAANAALTIEQAIRLHAQLGEKIHQAIGAGAAAKEGAKTE